MILDAAPAAVFRPAPGVQTKLIALPAPIDDALLGGGRFGGKSFALAFEWLKHAKAYGQFANGLCFRQTFDELEQLQKIFRRIFQPLGARWIAGRRCWSMPGGAELKLRYLSSVKDAEKHQGFSYTCILGDELGNYESLEPIDILQATLRSVDAPGIRKVFRGTANPGGPAHRMLKERYIDPAEPFTPFYDADAKSWRVYMPSTFRDNPYAANDPDYLAKIEKATVGQPAKRKAWLDGDWEAFIEGEVFQAGWMGQFWKTLPDDLFEQVISVDCSFKGAANSDEVAMLVYGRPRSMPARRYLVDRTVRRMTFRQTKTALRALIGAHPKARRVLVEMKANGDAIIDDMRDEFPGIIGFNPGNASKRERATISAGLYEAGNIWLPDPTLPGKEWVKDFIEEHLLFRGLGKAERDNQIDAEAQAVIDFASRPVETDLRAAALPRRYSGM